MFQFSVVLLIVIIAACTKRAQIPFRAWLPAAMAAPTPVSALVHSSTLVTAGVYLLIRFFKFLRLRSFICYLLVLGTLTILMARLRALSEIDMKKIVALSTLRQLGLMMRAIGIGLYNVAFFHLLVHAFFKALLFITVGNLIHMRNDYQDLRKVGKLIVFCPLTLSLMVLRNMRLCGVPFLGGFYSKDLWIEISQVILIGGGLRVLYFLSILITVFYTFRFIFLLGIFRIKGRITHFFDLDKESLLGYVVLGRLAILGGRALR